MRVRRAAQDKQQLFSRGAIKLVSRRALPAHAPSTDSRSRTMWTAERWSRIQELFEGAAALPEAERADWLRARCGDDRELCAQVERMLRADRIERGVVDGAALPAGAIDPFLGASFGVWRLEARIAEGGMGTVYRAVRADGAFPRPVAVKVLHVGLLSESMRRRFLREPRLLGRLEHKNIARLLDGGTTPDGIPYIAMELVDGEHVDRFCDRHRLGIRERLRLFETVCLAADYAHRSLVLHRDLKPSNILVTPNGEPRLVDFGVAALLEDPERGAARAATATNAAAYTPEFASPEQMRGDPAGITSDVWSLGVVLHVLLTGVRPFRAEQVRALAHDPRAAVPVPVPSARFAPNEADAEARAAARGSTAARLARALRGDHDHIVALALEPDAARRYATCRELADDVRRHLDGFPVLARPRSTAYRVARFVGRHRLATALVIALLVSLASGTVISARFARSAARERDVAVEARKAAEAEARHASIEAESAALTSEVLSDVFLNSSFFADPELRQRVGTRIREQAAEIRTMHAGDLHLCANLLDGLGNAARHVGLRDVARELIVEALEIRTRVFGADHLERALSLGNLGVLDLESGDVAAARAALEEACRLHLAHPREVHADVAGAKNDLAAACAACGDYERALELHREALALREQEDPQSLAVAESRNNLGAALLRFGKHEEARACLDIALAIRRRLLGDGAYLTLQCLGNRAAIAAMTGDFAAARRDLEDATLGMKKLRARGADALAVLLPRLAQAAMAQDDLAAAQGALDEAVAAAVATFGPEHPRTADALAQRAALHRRRGDYGASLADWEEVLRIRRAVLPAQHPSLTTTLYELGLARNDAGDPAGAERDLLASLAERPDDAPRNARARCALGALYTAAGRMEDAERELLRARADVGNDDADLRAAVLRELGKLYRATGRAAEAEALERQAR
jgi:serine/threonine-protein kinase